MPVFFGVMSSLLLGVGDYFGRFATRRSAAVTTVIAMLGTGVVVSLILVAIVPSTFIFRDLGLGLASGILVGVALALLYSGMARSSTAVVSPVMALGGVMVPLTFDLVSGEKLERLAIIGIVVAVASLVLTTLSPELGDRVRVGVAFGSASGLTFGLSLLLIGRTDIDSGMWAAFGQRAAGFLILLALAGVWSQPRILPAGLRVRGALCGALTTGGVACFVAGAQRGSLALVAVSGSMFPVVTAVLARFLDDDVLRWWQVIGIVGVITGIGLIAVA